MIELLTLLGALFAPLVVLGMDSAQSFYFFAEAAAGRSAQTRIVTAAVQWQFVWGLLISCVAVALSPLLRDWFFADAVPTSSFVVVFAGVWLSQIASSSVEVFRLRREPVRYVSLMLVQGGVTSVATIWFVLWVHLGVLGYFLGAFAGAVAAGAIAWRLLGGYLDLSRWHADWWPRMLRYGVPLVPAALAIYVTGTADRWLISHYRGAAEVGVYAAGAKIALIATLGVETFRKAWWPVAMMAAQREDGPALMRVSARYYFGVGAIVVTLLAAVAQPIVLFAVSSEYSGAYSIIAPLAGSSVLYGAIMVLGIGLWQTKRTKALASALVAAAVSNVILGVLLVPQFGGMGAAMATAAAYLVATVAVGWLAERVWPVSYPVRTLTALLLVTTGAVILIEEAQSNARSAWIIVAYTAIAVATLTFITRGRWTFATRGAPVRSKRSDITDEQ